MRGFVVLAALCLLAKGSAGATVVEANEPLVMRLIFTDCLGFVRHLRPPFDGLATQPLPAAATRGFPKAVQRTAQFVQLLSPRYAAAWGDDGQARYCMIRLISDPWPPPGHGLLGVEVKGFTARVTERARSEGLTDHPDPREEFSPFVVSSWFEPGEKESIGALRTVRIVLTATAGSEGDRILDVGQVIVGGPP